MRYMPRRYDENIDPSLAQTFRERVSDPEVDAVDWLWKYVAPEMAERRRARTAALLAVASDADRHSVRGRLHVLLVGPGGTGKTVLKDWVKHNLPDAVGVGPDSSEAGLKYNANTGEPGKLHLADDGIICIEEFDNFAKGERQATYEAMSEGYYEVDKGAVKADIDAETRVVAVANDLNTFADPLQSRFDFIIEVDEYDADETITVGTSMYDRFRQQYINGEMPDDQNILQKYLAWCSSYHPTLEREAHETIKQHLTTLIEAEGFVGEIRQKEAYIRAAYVIAKLNQRPIQPRDWRRSVDLIHPSVDVNDLFDTETETEGDTTTTTTTVTQPD